MNTRILLLAISVATLSSCSSVYRSGQTPDDVYYSPAPARQQADEYVNVQQPKQGTNYQTYEQYADNQRDDRFLRMSVGNPYYMNTYNMYSGFDWRYNSFYDGFNYGFYSPWNNYFAWNNFYNPYATGLYFGYGGFGGGYYAGGYGGGYGVGSGVKYTSYAAPISRPRVFNVNSYSNNNRPAGRTYVNGNYYNNNNQRYNNTNGNNNRTNNSYYNNNNNNARSTYTPSNSNSNNTPSRSYTPAPSSSGSSSSRGGGGGGGGVSRPSRGN